MNKVYRLKSSKSFEYIHKHGKSYANTNLVLIVAPTKFNYKVKRRLREGFRLLIPYLNTHFNYMIIARQNAADCDYHELLSSIKNLLLKANLVENKQDLNNIV